MNSLRAPTHSDKIAYARMRNAGATEESATNTIIDLLLAPCLESLDERTDHVAKTQLRVEEELRELRARQASTNVFESEEQWLNEAKTNIIPEMQDRQRELTGDFSDRAKILDGRHIRKIAQLKQINAYSRQKEDENYFQEKFHEIGKRISEYASGS